VGYSELAHPAYSEPPILHHHVDITEKENQGKQRKTEDRYFSLPWSYSLLKSSSHSIITLNFLQTFKTVKLGLSLTV
jgi:hypothetical protein